jgi:hypothetical protein
MIAKKNRLCMLAFSLVQLLSFVLPVRASDAERVQQLVDIIKNGPSLYRTPEAASAYAKYNPQGGVPAVSSTDGLVAIKQSLRAAIELADFGDKARDAVPALVEVFPQAEYLYVISGAQFAPGMGSFDDWVQTYVISSKNKFLLSSPFVEYQTLTRCEHYVEAAATTDIHQKRMAGNKVVEASVDIYVTIRINAAACALAKITGVEAGSTRESWRTWYSRSLGASAAAPSGQSAPVRITIVNTPANPPPDYVVGARYQITLTTGDVVTGVIESVDDASLTVRVDQGGRYSYDKSFVRSRTMISAAPYQYAPAPAASPVGQQAAPASGSIPYEDLMNFSYSGRTMEVVMQNGTVMRGALGVVDASILHLNVDGAEIPISRSLIARISVVPDAADTRQTDKPAGNAAPAPW